MMLQLLNDACADIAKEADFPEAAFPITTIAGQREYPMVECMKILRVYLLSNGSFAQPLPGSDIPTLEGDVLTIYDQSSGQVTGLPGHTPQWMAEAPQAYPLTNSPQGQGPVPTALPYYSVTASAQRGIFYRRGGNIGVVPIPSASGLILAVDHVPIQPTLFADSNFMIYPRIYNEALTAHMMMDMAASDRSAMLPSYQARYQQQLPELRTWLDTMQATKPKRFTPLTKRTFTRFGGGADDWWGGW